MSFIRRHTPQKTYRVRRIAAMFFRWSALLWVCLLAGALGVKHSAASGDGELRDLSPGGETVLEIAPGAKDISRVSLNPGQLLRLSIEKGDTALLLAFYNPEGQKLFEQVSHGYEMIECSFPANSTGWYRLEISSLERDSKRQYKLRVEPIVPSTPKDQMITAARQAVASASFLRVDWTERSLRRAIESYDAAGLAWLALHDFRKAAIASMDAGSVYLLLGEYREASKRYQKAAAQAKSSGARLEEAQALSQIGRLQSYLGNNVEAQKTLLKAKEFLAGNQPAVFRQALAEALSNSGEVNYSKGNLVQSLKDFDDALKLFTAVGDRSGEARVHLFKGYIAGGIGEPEKAVAELSQALSQFQAVGDKAGEGLSLTALGLSHSLRRDEEQAIKLHNEAGTIFRTIGDRQSEAITFIALGQAYEFLSDYPTALDNYRRALELFQDNGSLDFAAVANFKVAKAYRLAGDVPHALIFYEKSLKLSRAVKKRLTEANALNDVALLYATHGSQEKTVSQYRKILTFYESISDRRGLATALNSLGDYLLRFQQKKEALDSYKRALPLSEQVGDKALLISTLYNIARAERDLGALDEALTYIERSLKIVEDLRTNVATPEFRTSYFAGVRKQYELCINILMQLDRLHHGEGFAAKAFLTSESSRARSLNDLLIELRADIRQGAAPELLAREQELQGLLRSQARYQMELAAARTKEAESEEVTRDIKRLRAEYQEVQAQLRNQNQRFLDLTQPAQLSLDQIQAQLRDGDNILFEYALGDEQSYLWAVTSDSIQGYELPSRATLEAAGRDVYSLLTARQVTGGNVDSNYQAKVTAADSQYYEKALKLSNLMLGPVSAQLGARRLLIVSEGVLQYIPVDALPAPQNPGESSSGISGESPPLIGAHEIIMLPSMSTLTAIRQENRRPAVNNKLVAVLADPVFNASDDRVTSVTHPSTIAAANTDNRPGPSMVRASGTARLLHASEEADSILAATPRGAGMVARGFDASREVAMSPLVGEYRIVHFATHGFLNDGHPELSGIVLTMVNRDGSETNGFMQLQDIYNLNLSADLVVLSACDTALGKDIKGEGFVGLTHGFMAAGSRSVLASLWKVDDRATAALMAAFYKAMLQDGMTPAAALKVAKEKVRQEGAWRAPYFWAGFVLQGEYNEHIVVEHNTGFRTGLTIAIVLILISFGPPILRRRRRRSYLTRR